MSTVTYGQGTPPPPPTDPSVGYPPGTDWGQNDRTWLIEGYPFAVTHPSFDGTRLQIQTLSTEPWKGWCELQTPTGAGYPCGRYGCLPNWNYMGNPSTQGTLTDPATGATETVNSGNWVLCNYSPDVRVLGNLVHRRHDDGRGLVVRHAAVERQAGRNHGWRAGQRERAFHALAVRGPRRLRYVRGCLSDAGR